MALEMHFNKFHLLVRHNRDDNEETADVVEAASMPAFLFFVMPLPIDR